MRVGRVSDGIVAAAKVVAVVVIESVSKKIKVCKHLI
mgnify:CR=1 FL=1